MCININIYIGSLKNNLKNEARRLDILKKSEFFQITVSTIFQFSFFHKNIYLR